MKIEINGAAVATVPPTLFRPDVCEAIGAEGAFGFWTRLPRAVGFSDQVMLTIEATGEAIDPVPHRLRGEQLTFGVDRNALGLEIGALDNPFLDKKNFAVMYVDHATRDGLIEKYKATGTDKTFSARQVVNVDYVWEPGRPLKDCAKPGIFQYALACQVMEHVADPIGWLNEIAECLKPGGRINLSLPDMRRTFDYRRRLSNAADLLDAHERRSKRPDFRMVFDHISNAAQPPTVADQSPAGLQQALAVARQAQAGEYLDVHCYVWTYESFLECWNIVEKIGACKARLDQSWPPIFGHNEFVISLVI